MSCSNYTSLANHLNRHPARSYAWSINRTTRAQSCTLIGGAAPRRQWSSASRSVVKTGAVTLAPGRVWSPSAVASKRAKAPRGEQLAGPRGEGRVALRQRDGDERIKPCRLGSYRLHLGRVDPHRLFQEEGTALIEQVVGDAGHLPVSPERQHEVRTGRRQHLSVIRESWRAPHLGRSFRDKTGVRVLDGHQLHVRHGDEVAEVSGVIECVPVTHLALLLSSLLQHLWLLLRHRPLLGTRGD